WSSDVCSSDLVLVADDDEALAFRQATGGAGVVVDVVAAAGGDVVGPEADLVVVAQPVAVFGPVEVRWGGVGGQQVHGFAADADRQVPVGLGGQPQVTEFFRGVPVGRFGGPGVVRELRAGHVGPAEVLEGADLLDRVLGEHHHPVLAGELPEAEGVVRAA